MAAFSGIEPVQLLAGEGDGGDWPVFGSVEDLRHTAVGLADLDTQRGGEIDLAAGIGDSAGNAAVPSRLWDFEPVERFAMNQGMGGGDLKRPTEAGLGVGDDQHRLVRGERDSGRNSDFAAVVDDLRTPAGLEEANGLPRRAGEIDFRGGGDGEAGCLYILRDDALAGGTVGDDPAAGGLSGIEDAIRPGGQGGCAAAMFLEHGDSAVR